MDSQYFLFCMTYVLEQATTGVGPHDGNGLPFVEPKIACKVRKDSGRVESHRWQHPMRTSGFRARHRLSVGIETNTVCIFAIHSTEPVLSEVDRLSDLSVIGSIGAYHCR